jgi:CRP-like cAMP-binding protein
LGEDENTLGYLNAGSFFGELAVLVDTGLLDEGSIAHRSITAVTTCDMLYLTKTDVHEVAKEYPALEVALKHFAHIRSTQAKMLGLEADILVDKRGTTRPVSAPVSDRPLTKRELLTRLEAMEASTETGTP